MKTCLTLLLLSVIAACSGGGGGGNATTSNTEGGKTPANEAPVAPPAPYNIVLVLADDLAFDHYGFAGHSVLATPALDQLAEQSVRFPATYVSSTCRPTQASLLTGLAEHRHQVTYLNGPTLGDFSTIADRLGNAGYSTLMAGKFWEGSPAARGFTAATPFESIGGDLQIGRTTIQPIFDFIQEASTPWFVWFSPQMPHIPHDAPDEFIAMYADRGLSSTTAEYFAMISWFDSVVGKLLQTLGENTVVVYLADNGYVQSDVNGLQTPTSKASSYEHGIRTQLLIRHPEHKAVIIEDLAGVVDVAATILAIAGATHSDLPGRNLLLPSATEPTVFGSRSTLGLVAEPDTLLERWARVGPWKLVDTEYGQDRLYNLDNDPLETHNLIEDPTIVDELSDIRAYMESWWQL